MSRSILIRDRLFECIHKGEIDNSDLILILGHVCKILNLQTTSNFAKNTGKTYNGVKYAKNETITIDNVKFYIDND